ncbi:hypothetical protein BCS84_08460 [Vibrio cyclitrophicus]|uniref:hypothetical protein n=1 Tax=Vibrio TaxID=662 RepID=UPI0002F8B29D|nr:MULTISPECIES: hypothetical protein [Vibrio]MBE8557190.1 hypothetical protein [Vibrio sp. OPT24]
MHEYECENCPIVYCFDDCHSALKEAKIIDIEALAKRVDEETSQSARVNKVPQELDHQQ